MLRSVQGEDPTETVATTDDLIQYLFDHNLIRGVVNVDAERDELFTVPNPGRVLLVDNEGNIQGVKNNPVRTEGKQDITIRSIRPWLDDKNKLAVSVYGAGAAAGDTPMAMSLLGADGVANTVDGARTVPMPTLYNGTTWDRQRNNEDVVLLASAVRAANTASAIQTNHNARGVVLLLDVTANAGGAETLSVVLQTRSPLTTIQTSLVVSPAEAFGGVAGSRLIMLYPGVLDADLSNAPDIGASLALPRTWIATVVHSAAGNWTYSLEAWYIV